MDKLRSEEPTSAHTSTSQHITEGSHGRNLETEAGTGATEGCCLLACSLCLAQPAASDHPEGVGGHFQDTFLEHKASEAISAPAGDLVTVPCSGLLRCDGTQRLFRR